MIHRGPALVAGVVALSAALTLAAGVDARGPDGSKTVGGKAEVVPGGLPEVLAEIRKPGSRAVLLNVWATWCDPCREEMPDLVRLWRAYREQGLRLVLVSADDPKERDAAAKFLASQGIDFRSFVKIGDDNAFIDGLERRWTGALPASILYDGSGGKQQFWPGPIRYEDARRKIEEVLKAPKAPGTRRSPP